ncbi:hypothetical protein CF166_31120 [Amycolatopsis sp. KNN50.9b]|nr:hypothetical protein CF166_31120 [Amycolatopsis sp. KNN50.9b]
MASARWHDFSVQLAAGGPVQELLFPRPVEQVAALGELGLRGGELTEPGEDSAQHPHAWSVLR